MENLTKQRKEILDYIRTLDDKPFYADDLLLHFFSSKSKISKATIYRALDFFKQQSIVRQYYINPQDPALYQYIKGQESCSSHLHAACLKCDKLFHIECKDFNNLVNHLEGSHHFKIDQNRTILYGLCQQCSVL